MKTNSYYLSNKKNQVILLSNFEECIPKLILKLFQSAFFPCGMHISFFIYKPVTDIIIQI